MGSSILFNWLTAVTIASAAGCIAAVLIGVWSWRLPVFPGRNSFVVSMGGIAWWTAAIALEHASLSLPQQVLWSEMAWFGIILGTGYWAIFVWNYVHGRTRPLPRAAHVTMLVTALLVFALALTNGSHHLLYSGVVPVGRPPLVTTRFIHGPLFYAIVVVFYLVVTVTDIVIIAAAAESRSIYRSHYIGMAVVTVLPWLSNILYVSGVVKGLSFDITPLSFVFADAILYWLMRRRHLFDLLPIAHGMLLDAIPDPVIVLDGEKRIVEWNSAARRLAGERELVGMSLSAVAGLEKGLDSLEDRASGSKEVVIGDPPRYFDIGRVSLPYAGRQVGQLLVLRDVTHLKEVEHRLQTAMADLERQLQDNLALQLKLREQSIRDPLTGLHNRRFLDELGPVMLAEARRSALPLAAVMIDVDRFKLLNDTYGHLAGDAVLRATGSFLRNRIRKSDAVFRLGGEEFLLLLAHTREEAALQRVEEWRSLFPSQGPFHEGGRIEATFSAGVAFYPVDADSLAELLRLADKALYQAKLEGRNRTVRHHADAS